MRLVVQKVDNNLEVYHFGDGDYLSVERDTRTLIKRDTFSKQSIAIGQVEDIDWISFQTVHLMDD